MQSYQVTVTIEVPEVVAKSPDDAISAVQTAIRSVFDNPNSLRFYRQYANGYINNSSAKPPIAIHGRQGEDCPLCDSKNAG